MAERLTSTGAEYLSQVSNKARLTATGAEYLFAVPNKARLTAVGVEYLARVLVPAHDISGYLRDQLVNHLFRTSALEKPASIWVALYTLQPTASGGGSEVSGNGYARVQVGPSDAAWDGPTAGNGIATSILDFVFPTPTADWGTLSAWGLFDAGAGGNLLMFSTFSAGIFVASGSNPRFVASALTVTLA